MRMPILEAVQTVNKYGIEAASGIIMGLDTDSGRNPAGADGFRRCLANPDHDGEHPLRAAEHRALHAAGKRQSRAPGGRGGESRLQHRLPAALRNRGAQLAKGHCPRFQTRRISTQRYAYNALYVYPNRIKPKNPLAQATWPNISQGVKYFPTHSLARGRLQRLPQAISGR